MKTQRFCYAAISIGAAALFAGCIGPAAPPISAPGATTQTSARASSRTDPRRTTTSSYEVLYRFSRSADGGRPEGSLLAVNGMLYGTTRFGGGGACNNYDGTGCGTVYRLDPKSGRKKRLYSFGGGGADGAYPNGSLIDVNGTLYGTTMGGGGGCGSSDGCGTVFSISTTGMETVLHSFDNKSDGRLPSAGLIDVNGTLYGTTAGGGSCCGTVYSVSTSGSEKVVYNFRGHTDDDGGDPQADLIDVKGTLYGTTAYGGSSDDGTVYSVTTTGSENVLHSFTGSPDGATPSSGLIDLRGTLYGTTPSGGNALCYEVSYTCGIVYSISTSGKEKVFYTFSPANDYGGGAAPSAGLVNVNGILYGTAPVGGNGYGCYDIGCGVVYSLTTTAQETVLHVFNGGADGARPDSTMIDVDGTLYGTTPYGGGSNCPKTGTRHSGCGTVFALTP